MFIDEAGIYVKGGNGGAGCVGFRREKFVPRGGPDGGDGGHGGTVYMEAVVGIDTLLDMAGRHHWRAGNGMPGMGKCMYGKKGRDLIIRVPPGTLIYDKDTGLLIKDLAQDGQRVCVALGGKGGKGNKFFATPTNQAPRFAQTGIKGQERNLHLELKLVADVGLIGMPNAGKSTLLSRISAARPKIADYPFTTLEPALGIADLPGHRRLVIADLPGLIEGAHQGHGLGDTFLKHIERTKVVVHMLDILPLEGDPVENYRIIRKELEQYSQLLATKPQYVVANKMDLTDSQEALEQLSDKLGIAVLGISAVSGQGVQQLLQRLWLMVHEDQARHEDKQDDQDEQSNQS